MFEQSTFASTHRIEGRSRRAFWAAFGLQAGIVSVLAGLPLLHPESIGRLSFSPPQLIFPAPVPPTPPRVRAVVQAAAAQSLPAAASVPASAPRLSPAILPSMADRSGPPVAPGDGPPSLAAATDGAGMGGFPGISRDVLAIAPAEPRVAVAKPAGPVHISRGVTAGMLLQPIRPVYSAMALAARATGTVEIRAIISSTGAIASATVVSGPVLLCESALAAVKAARYRPYLLNGQPTEVDTTILIHFQLGD